MLVVNLTAAQYTDAALQDELAGLLDMADAGGLGYGMQYLSALNLRIRGIEAVEIYVDGVPTDPRDPGAPNLVAEDDVFSTGENTVLAEDVATNDSYPAGAVFSLLTTVSSGVLTLNGDGTFSFDAGSDFDALAVGDTAVESFTYSVSAGGSSATATLTITGTNDAPEVAAALSASAAEDDAEFTLDLLAGAIDADNGATLSVQNLTGLSTGLSLVGGTQVAVNPAHSVFQSIPEGDTRTITLTYDIVDEHDASVPQTATITLTGTNDTPFVVGALNQTLAEDSLWMDFNLLQGALDRDAGDTLSAVNVSALPAGFSLSGNSLIVDPADASFQSLNVGDSVTHVVNYDVEDQLGASVPQSVTVTITGTNDVPEVAAALSASAAEDDAVFTVDLLDGASGVDAGAVLSATNVSGVPAWAALVGNSLEVDPGHADLQSLNVGDTATAVVSYTVEDEHGASVPQTATLTITGTNDAPTVAFALAYSAAEDRSPFDIDLLLGADDVDDGAVLSIINMDPIPAGFSLVGNTLTVDAGDAAFQYLDLGETLAVTLNFEISDENGGTVPQSVTVTFLGRNDAPVVSAELTGTTNEDVSGFTADLLEHASDVDASEVIFAQNMVQTAGRATPFSVLGNEITIDPSGFQDLALGESETVSFSYEVSDGDVAVPATATFTIEGRNDAPMVNGTVDLQLATNGTAFSLMPDPGLFTDVDASDTLTMSAQLVGGSPLPSWLSVDPGTGELSGTPPSGAGLYHIELTATDPHGESASTQFWLAQTDAVLTGTPGRDTLTGTNAPEILLGLEGNDSLSGGRGDDIYIIRDGEDIDFIEDNGFTGADKLFLPGLTPSDVELDRLGPGSSDLAIRKDGELMAIVKRALDGDAGDTIAELVFEDGTTMTVFEIRDLFLAQDQGTGNDRVFGFAGDQTIDGGEGNDYLSGRGGSDTYEFEAGDGRDVVWDDGFGSTDVVRFLDYASTDASFISKPGDRSTVIIDFGNGDSVELRNAVDTNASYEIEQVTFDGDGVTFTPEQLRQLLIHQSETAGDDSIVGFGLNNELEGGLGDDFLTGKRGSDTYVFNMGGGRDRILDDGFSSTDTLRFTDYALADATFSRVAGYANDVLISFANGDSVTIMGGFDGGATNGIERIEFLGSGGLELLTQPDVRATILSSEPTSGDDVISADFSTNDTVNGGAGNDFLTLGRGSDTYVFEAGGGRDRIFDNGFNATDVLDLTDFVIADASFRLREGQPEKLVITLPGGDEVIVIGQTGTAGNIEQFVFSDGTLSYADILASPAFTGAPGDVFTGTAGADTLSANGGYDHLFGLGGDDT
ncbi:VCBS domain-containing protein [Marimonas lutisalis]|uniref:VCBS domain-containing protein n=1 Tax=Marimonas lutisalis TaxID=2545756 RepID=UPI0010F7F5B6|nr:VCBS domain-containing protein [Marimonas lutisalis]